MCIRDRFLIDLTANTITLKNTSGNTVFSFDGNGNLTISGKITATSGSIAGFTIYGDRLQGGNCTLYSDYTNGRLVLGNTVLNGYGGMVAGLNCNAPFTAVSYTNLRCATGWALRRWTVWMTS